MKFVKKFQIRVINKHFDSRFDHFCIAEVEKELQGKNPLLEYGATDHQITSNQSSKPCTHLIYQFHSYFK